MLVGNVRAGKMSNLQLYTREEANAHMFLHVEDAGWHGHNRVSGLVASAERCLNFISIYTSEEAGTRMFLLFSMWHAHNRMSVRTLDTS